MIKTAPIKWLKSYWRSKGVVTDLIKDEINFSHKICGMDPKTAEAIRTNDLKIFKEIYDNFKKLLCKFD